MPVPNRPTRWSTLAAIGVAVALSVACAGPTPGTTSGAVAGLTFDGSATDLPVTVIDSTGAAATVASAERIVPINGDLAEVVYALGLGDRVVARDLAAGGTDVAAELGVPDSAPVDAEALITAAPDVLLVTTTGLESVGGVDGLLALDNGALARTPAGEQRRVVAFEDQYLLGFGPRTGALLTDLTRALHPEVLP